MVSAIFLFLIVKTTTKIWNSWGVFFSYIISYRILSAFFQRIFRSAKYIFCKIYFKKIYEYFRNLSNSFINILAILQDFNEIFSKYFLNITVLCGRDFRSRTHTWNNITTRIFFFLVVCDFESLMPWCFKISKCMLFEHRTRVSRILAPLTNFHGARQTGVA